MLPCIIHREYHSPQQYSSRMSKEDSLTSQQDQAFQSKSHQSTEELQFVHPGTQMSTITSKHTSVASEKVKPTNITVHKKFIFFITSGMSTVLSPLPFTSPLVQLNLVRGKGQHSKTRQKRYRL